jgi:hypothetical protein
MRKVGLLDAGSQATDNKASPNKCEYGKRRQSVGQTMENETWSCGND